MLILVLNASHADRGVLDLIVVGNNVESFLKDIISTLVVDYFSGPCCSFVGTIQRLQVLESWLCPTCLDGRHCRTKQNKKFLLASRIMMVLVWYQISRHIPTFYQPSQRKTLPPGRNRASPVVLLLLVRARPSSISSCLHQHSQLVLIVIRQS